jgi:RHS repeat-associated protein
MMYKNNKPYQIPTAEGRIIAPPSGAGGPWTYEYDYKDHLGNTRLSYRDKNGQLTKTAETHYDPWGITLQGIGQKNNPANRWELQGKEKESTFGLNRIMFGARTYNPTIGRFDGVDPLAEKYASMSPYAYCANNPIIFKDPDGRDIVYFDVMGNELANKRVVSNKVFQTHIARDKENTSFSQVPMPNVIQERTQSGEDVSGSEYQENDYIISARTGLFNQTKNAGLLQLYTEGGDAIPKDEASKIPDLDPTLVKAIATQESHNGTTGVADIMTANGVGSDFKPFKTKYGLSKTESLNVNRSLYLGIRFLATKGFRSGVTYDKKTGAKTYTFQGWNTATGNYNGGGVEGYQGYVETMVDDSKKTTPSDH